MLDQDKVFVDEIVIGLEPFYQYSENRLLLNIVKQKLEES
jgi:hypothetical protein